MAAETKASVATRFANGAYVSALDFGALIDSYQDASDVLFAVASAAQNGSKGVVVVSGSSLVTFHSAAAQGLKLLNTATTAAAQQQLGGGTVGRVVFEAGTTAAAQAAVGGGTVGRSIFETATTAAAQDIIGTVSAATQTEMETATATGVMVTPGNAKFHPGVVKAWAHVTITAGNPTLAAGYNFSSSITDHGPGEFTLTFSSAMSGSLYAAVGTAENSVRTEVRITSRSASAIRVYLADAAGSGVDAAAFSLVVLGDFA